MYKPLPDHITIKESSINGLGLFATEKIDAHSLIGVTHHPRKESDTKKEQHQSHQHDVELAPNATNEQRRAADDHPN